MTEELKSLYEELGLSVIYMHNHLNNYAFDGYDYKVFYKFKAIYKMILFCENGNVYYIAKKNARLYFTNYDRVNIDGTIKELHDKLFGEYFQELHDDNGYSLEDIESYIWENLEETKRIIYERFLKSFCERLNDKMEFDYYPKGV